MKPVMKSVTLLSALCIGAIGVFAVLPDTTEAKSKPGDVPVIVELFTSEGCSSCPPADAALKELARTQPVPGADIVVLGYHVDYWNRLGWRDPFSSASYSARQEAYRQRFGGDSVYTPQAIVGGVAEFVGSDSGRAKIEIARAAEQLRKKIVSVSILPAGGDAYNVKVTGKSPVKDAHLFVAVTENGLATQVKSGENAGRNLPHVSVVRRLTSLGEKTSAKVILPVLAGEKRENQRIVAWVQEGQTGTIVGAGQSAR